MDGLKIGDMVRLPYLDGIYIVLDVLTNHVRLTASTQFNGFWARKEECALVENGWTE